MDHGAFSDEVQYITEERNSLEQGNRNNGEYHQRKAAELDAVQALARPEILQSRPSSPGKKQPIKFKDVVGRKFLFPFELSSTWQVSPNFYYS